MDQTVELIHFPLVFMQLFHAYTTLLFKLTEDIFPHACRQEAENALNLFRSAPCCRQ